jgi:flagellin-specific chaperone FliS
MEDNLDKALNSVLDQQIVSKKSVSASIPQDQDMTQLGELALEHYNRAKDYLRQGNWAEYGRELENLEKILTELARINEEKK